MKLYATITSERATKGQGGNRELVINITVGNISRREIANIVLRTNGGSIIDPSKDIYALEYYPVNRDKGGRVVLDTGTIELKTAHKHTYLAHDVIKDWQGYGGYVCTTCKAIKTKGEKQKGECNYVSEDSNVCITHDIEH